MIQAIKNQMNERNNNFEKALDTIRMSNRFFIGTHVFPDGDNIGSVIALHYILEQLGKSVYSYCETDIPQFYEWMKGIEKIRHEIPDESVGNFDVIIVLDSGDLKRLGRKFYEWSRDDKTQIINIDHHVTNNGYGDINWVDSTYAATGEQVYEIARAFSTQITPNIAQALYTAIYTDTGRFSYSNTSARTLFFAAELVNAGVNPNHVYRKVYASRSLAALELEREVLNSLVYDDELHLAYMTMTLDMIERTGALIADSEGIIEHVALFGESIKNMLLFKETAPDEVKVSVRSRGEWDASKVALLFGGGGHRGAGGFSARGSISDVISISLNRIKQAINDGTINRD